ncbi:MAG TPA: universal stress protein [Robiginitalea sp.]|nr:universal stress protein [Robiginitalea sp.]
MDHINNILIPFDFSVSAKRALQYAFDFAGNRPDKHMKLCFIQPDKAPKDFKAEFEEISARLPKTFRARLSWVALEPATVEGLLQYSREDGSDLILMGTSGSDDPNGNTHTSETVLASDCPVLVIPPGAPEDFRIEKIALVLGRNEIEDPKVLGTLLDVARTFNAKVRVLTIENKPGTYGYSKGEERNEQLLEYYLENFYSHHIFIEHADVVEGIFDYATEKEIDLLAILPRNHSRAGTPSEGRLTRILTLRSHTPLLAIEQ